MRPIPSLMLLAALPAVVVLLLCPAARAEGPRKLAVLEFALELDEKLDRTYFADRVREVVRQQLPAEQFFIMTRESTEELLKANGKTLADCLGNCEVETGRLLAADLVISGRITRVGSRYKLSMRLHQMRDGALLSSATASGESVDKLDDAMQAAAEDLVAPIAPQGTPKTFVAAPAKPRVQQAILSVMTTPAGAVIKVDGQERGTSPTSLELRPGRHVVEASLPGYAAATRELQLAASDRPEKLSLSLQRLTGRVSVASNAACRCSAGETSFNVDEGSVEVVELPTGPVALECRTSDGRTASATVAVATEGLAGTRLSFDAPRKREPEPEPDVPHERTGWAKRFDRPLEWGLVVGLGQLAGKDIGSGLGLTFDAQLRLAETLLLEAGVQTFFASRDGANAGDPSISTSPVGVRGGALLTPFDLGPFRPYGGARVVHDTDNLGTGVAIVAGLGLNLGARWSVEWQGGQTGWLSGTSSYVLTFQPWEGWAF